MELSSYEVIKLCSYMTFNLKSEVPSFQRTSPSPFQRESGRMFLVSSLPF